MEKLEGRRGSSSSSTFSSVLVLSVSVRGSVLLSSSPSSIWDMVVSRG